MEHLLGFGFKLYVDNWYTSEALFRYLYKNQTCAVRTARKNRLQIPNSLKEVKLSRGEFSFRRNGNMLLLRYQDKKEIYMFSTMHTADVIDVTTDVEMKAPNLLPNLLLFMITTRKWEV